MTGFRIVLQDMEADVKFLAKEKKSQYEKMKESVSLMEQMEKKANKKIEMENQKQEERNLQIAEFRATLESMQGKMNQLEELAQKN